MKTYRVNATRVGQWWSLDAPEVRFGSSQCKRLDQAEDVIREAIAIALDVDGDSFGISLSVEPPPGVTAAVERAQASRRRIAELQDEYFSAVADIVLDEGLTYRDAGVILGISHQRVGQIVKEGRDRPEGGLIDA